jgi:aldehyde dehydrogenase family 7 member A1
LQFLKELGIDGDNLGVYNGKWGGSGDSLTSYNPSTGLPVARVKQATEKDYEECLAAMEAAKKPWAEVRTI